MVGEGRIEAGGIPARMYDPEQARGLLFLGHRGGRSKDDPRMVELGRLYAATTGLTVVCIDASAHGERSPRTGDPAEDERQLREALFNGADQMAADWRAVAAALGDPVAYVGFSLSALFGIQAVAALSSVGAAVFVAAGIPAAEVADPGDGRPGPLEMAAGRLGHAQVLMVNMTQDKTFVRAEALALFDAVRARGKRLMFWQGDHNHEPKEAIQATVDFLNNHTTAAC